MASIPTGVPCARLARCGTSSHTSWKHRSAVHSGLTKACAHAVGMGLCPSALAARGWGVCVRGSMPQRPRLLGLAIPLLVLGMIAQARAPSWIAAVLLGAAIITSLGALIQEIQRHRRS